MPFRSDMTWTCQALMINVNAQTCIKSQRLIKCFLGMMVKLKLKPLLNHSNDWIYQESQSATLTTPFVHFITALKLMILSRSVLRPFKDHPFFRDNYSDLGIVFSFCIFMTSFDILHDVSSMWHQQFFILFMVSEDVLFVFYYVAIFSNFWCFFNAQEKKQTKCVGVSRNAS